MTWDGPFYYSMGVDEERDEFEIEFDEGCAKLLTHNRNYLMLSDEHLEKLVTLNKFAEAEYLEWAASDMGKDFEALAKDELSGGEEAQVRAKYAAAIDTRRKVLVQ